MIRNLHNGYKMCGEKTAKIIVLLATLLLFHLSLAQQEDAKHFIDNFKSAVLKLDKQGLDGWAFYTGDGQATMKFTASGKGYATISVDATYDKLGIWWALVKRCVSKKMKLELLSNPKYEFRVEARIRISDAPKRVNLHLNTQRTTDFHTHLMEFDIPDTTQWHTISMTTKNFDAKPGDTVYAQLALMDWGFEQYRVDIDYYRVDIVNVDSIGKDEGEQVPYHPAIPLISSFAYHLPASQNAVVDLIFQDMNFYNWRSEDDSVKVLSVSGTQYVILRWDFDSLHSCVPSGSGILELTTHALQRSLDYEKDFGMIRVVEIIGGDPKWEGKSVTYKSWSSNASHVLNSQMIIDVLPCQHRQGKTFATISRPVLQRLFNGRTLGLALIPLGSAHASFYSLENGFNVCPKLHINLENNDSNR